MKKAKSKKKRVLIIADLHCGHRVGLTPSNWESNSDSNKKYHNIREQLYDAYIGMVKPLRADILFINGDAIDGTGRRSGGTEEIVTDRNKQVEMAIDCIKETGVHPDNIVLTYGTGFHTGESEDFEYILKKELKAKKIGDQEWIEVNRVTFDLKHQAEGSSSMPYGKGTPLSKERLWNLLWNDQKNMQPKADILIRSHCHYHFFCGELDWLAMFTPALQGAGSKFGGRRKSGIVHFGIVWFDIWPDGRYEWHSNIVWVDSQKAKLIKL